MINWFMTFIAFLITLVVYKYIDASAQENNWGDIISGLRFQSVRNSLLLLEKSDIRTKNWRPQLLVLLGAVNKKDAIAKEILQLAEQLKKGHGLIVASTIVKGEIKKKKNREFKAEIEKKLKELMQEANINGFGEVVLMPNIDLGMQTILQTAGLGKMKPNTVLLGWPRHDDNSDHITTYYEMLLVS